MEVDKAQSGRFKPQIESDAAQNDMASLDKEGFNSLSSPETRELTTGADAQECSLPPAKYQECIEHVNMKEAGVQSPANILNKHPAEKEGEPCFIEEDSNRVKTRECCPIPADYRDGTQEMEETGTEVVNTLQEAPAAVEDHPCSSSDNAHTVLMGNSKEGGDAVSSGMYKDDAVQGDGLVVSCKNLNDTEKVEGELLEEENDGAGRVFKRAEGGGKAFSSNAPDDNAVRADAQGAPRKGLDDNEKVEESSLEEENDGVKQVIERPEESITGLSMLPRILMKGTSENDVSPLCLSANESRKQENGNRNQLGGESGVPSLTNDLHDITQKEASSSKGEWPEQVLGGTTLISTDLEGWQRFDADEVVNNLAENAQGSEKKVELWEKLLDDGFDTDGVVSHNLPLQVAVVQSPFEENQYDLASPVNPFVEEGQERTSNLSEADGFARHIAFPSFGRPSQSAKDSVFFRFQEGSFPYANSEVDMPSVLNKVDGEMNAAQLEAITPSGSKPGLQPPALHHPLPSFDAMEPFEAPSFMSLVDPKSHALFEASMPKFQASTSMYAQEGRSGEKWVANFELIAPSTQEITRSSSMPLPGGEAPGHRPGQSFSFGTGRDQEPSKNKSASSQAEQQTKSGLWSPKFSPMVQKLVEKVRTSPAVANGVLNSVRQVVMTPKASDKKETPKSLLSRCTCW